MNLTTEQLNILNHVVVDGQGWADNAGENNMLAKVEKYRQSYLDAQGEGYQTRKQKEDEVDRIQKDARENVSYAIKRQRSYPFIGDQLDALWKGGDDAAAMKVIIDKVKSDNPK